ncbi:MAG: single-stranded DNA-binding protein [Bacteroidia bacterium]
MNSLRNSVRLIGHLGTNPEVKEFEKGTKVARITLATNESYTNQKGEKVTDTTWHTCVAWGKSAEFAAKNFTKGNEVAIEGRLTQRNYTDKEGVKKYITEIVVNDMMMFGKKVAE